jgi:archaellum component FlaF (FlaF/FlaG flagellin family)
MGIVEVASAMILSLIVLFLCFTALYQSQGSVYFSGALRYNRRHENVAEILNMGQISSRSGILVSQRRLAGQLGRAAGSRES